MRSAVVILGVTAAVVSGCGGEKIEPARDGGSPACTALIARLPGSVLDRERRDLDVAGAARWGDPAVVLRCGVPPLAPTTDRCIDVDGVNWVLLAEGDSYRFETYGRTPAVEVTVPGSVEKTNATSALVDLKAAVEPLPVSRQCYGQDDA